MQRSCCESRVPRQGELAAGVNGDLDHRCTGAFSLTLSWEVVSVGVSSGYLRSLVLGTTFAIAWSPCIGPILAGVLTLAATSGSAVHGTLLLVAYALGLGVWFLALGVFFDALAPRLRSVQRFTPTVLMLAGGVFVLIGGLMVLGQFGRLNAYAQSFGILMGSANGSELALADSLGDSIGILVAFAGGVLSFLSPCVLPLVPAYLANLTGGAVLDSSADGVSRRRTLAHASVFVAGFTVVFAVTGSLAGLAGTAVVQQFDLLTRVGGALIVLLGLQLAGVIHLPYLDRTYQLPAPH